MVPRLKERFDSELLPRLMKAREYSNPMAVPRLVKIVLNMGVGNASQDIKELDKAIDELGSITGCHGRLQLGTRP